jgi:hypothetical protein
VRNDSFFILHTTNILSPYKTHIGKIYLVQIGDKEMKTNLIDELWIELKDLFYQVRCEGLSEEKKHDLWCQYSINLINRVGEESEMRKPIDLNCIGTIDSEVRELEADLKLAVEALEKTRDVLNTEGIDSDICFSLWVYIGERLQQIKESDNE